MKSLSVFVFVWVYMDRKSNQLINCLTFLYSCFGIVYSIESFSSFDICLLYFINHEILSYQTSCFSVHVWISQIHWISLNSKKEYWGEMQLNYTQFFMQLNKKYASTPPPTSNISTQLPSSNIKSPNTTIK